MTRTAQPLTLNNHETRSLTKLLTRGAASARSLARARILDLLHRSHHPTEVAASLQVSVQTVYNVKRRYLAAGLEAALFDQPRAGRPIEIDGRQRAQITALACSTPPQGRARWTLRLLADRAVELGYCESLSHTKARQILKKTVSSHISRSNGASGR
jgi:putative transposase